MEVKKIDAEIESLTEELNQYSGSDARHAAILTEIERLEKLKTPPKPERKWWQLETSTINTLIASGVALVQMIMVCNFEKTGSFRTKGISWVNKPKG